MHCDLKPENILVAQRVDNEPTRVKIIDLGSACVEGRTAQQYVQSRFYRAPEVLVAAPYDGAVDGSAEDGGAAGSEALPPPVSIV